MPFRGASSGAYAQGCRAAVVKQSEIATGARRIEDTLSPFRDSVDGRQT